jgi:formamidopyrimidine-DNA glycosylase
MPELIEVESYRRTAALAIGRRITAIEASDAWFLKRTTAAELSAIFLEAQIISARRIGKLLLLDLSSEATVGLRFGMTGRLLVDDADDVGALRYSSGEARPEWDRFALCFADGGRMRLNDPRRLGGVEPGPDEHRLGPDAAGLTKGQLSVALAGGATAVKARLLDQERIAGLGNLLVDEILWRAGIAPSTPAGEIRGARFSRLFLHLQATIAELTERGGSHTGDLQSARDARGACPRCGVTLRVSTVGGRTTVWCARHQR